MQHTCCHEMRQCYCVPRKIATNNSLEFTLCSLSQVLLSSQDLYIHENSFGCGGPFMAVTTSHVGGMMDHEARVGRRQPW